MFPVDSTFLLVDDSMAFRTRLKFQLNELGYFNVIEADSGASAIDRIHLLYLQQERVDLIISDWKMPVMTGFELFNRLKRHHIYKAIPFIMLTAVGDIQEVTAAVLSGVS